jgi:two-component system, chemotaxis family, protein-glutamate methylesterase/glutaminase
MNEEKRVPVNFEAVVIGVSAGGLEALNVILPALPVDFPIPIIIVQHQHPASDDYLARSLNQKCQLTVKQADEKENIQPCVVYIAPPNYHLMIEDDRTFSLSIDARVNYARPSIDVLFETAADVYGAALIGIILTGANSDGSAGLKKIKQRGGLAIVQDPETATIDAMPKAAIAATAVDYVLRLEQVCPFLVKLCRGEA